jgi:hypothetical protein
MPFGERPRILALLACALPCLAAGQQSPAKAPPSEIGAPPLRNYTPKEYGAQPQVWTIAQDRRGVMYFGVAELILEYDGVTWRKIRVPSSIVRSLAMDAAGRIWVGANATFGYLAPDAHGSLQYVSLVDKIPPGDRTFGDVWPILITPQGNFFKAANRLFRWDGKTMHVWAAKTRFPWMSDVRGRIFTSQTGVGLQEIVGDELRDAPGGEAWKNSDRLFMMPYDGNRILVAARGAALSLYDGEKATPFPTQADDYLRKSIINTAVALPDASASTPARAAW